MPGSGGSGESAEEVAVGFGRANGEVRRLVLKYNMLFGEDPLCQIKDRAAELGVSVESRNRYPRVRRATSVMAS